MSYFSFITSDTHLSITPNHHFNGYVHVPGRTVKVRFYDGEGCFLTEDGNEFDIFVFMAIAIFGKNKLHGLTEEEKRTIGILSLRDEEDYTPFYRSSDGRMAFHYYSLSPDESLNRICGVFDLKCNDIMFFSENEVVTIDGVLSSIKEHIDNNRLCEDEDYMKSNINIKISEGCSNYFKENILRSCPYGGYPEDKTKSTGYYSD